MKRVLLLTTLLASPCWADETLSAQDQLNAAKDGLYNCYHVNGTVRCDPVDKPATCQPVGPSNVIEDMQAHVHQHKVCVADAQKLHGQFYQHRALEACEVKR